MVERCATPVAGATALQRQPAPAAAPRVVLAPARRPTPAVFWQRRVLALAGVLLGLWLSAAAIGGITTALRGLEGRPLTVPELAGAGQSGSPSEAATAAAGGGGLAGAADRSGGPVLVHVVQPGETLWDIARTLQPSGDIRPLVDRLARAHGPGPLQAGERLVLPRR